VTGRKRISRIFVFQISEKCNNIFVSINKSMCLTLEARIKSHLLFAGIIRSSPFSPR